MNAPNVLAGSRLITKRLDRVLRTASGQEILVDASDYERLSGYSWHVQQSTSRRKGRPFRRGPRADGAKTIYLCHEILSREPGQFIDHINGDPLDNRRCNLRLCTPAENARNRDKKRGNKRRFKGVFPNGPNWQACIGHDYRVHYLGTFKTEEEAARAYDAAAVRLHGDFARLNFSGGDANGA